MAALFTLVLFSSAGLPGLNGFPGEFLILLGAFQAQPAAAVVAASGVVLAAVYLVWMFQRAMHGADSGAGSGKEDLSRRELATLVPIVAMVVWIGIFPTSLLAPMEASVGNLVSRVAPARASGQVEVIEAQTRAQEATHGQQSDRTALAAVRQQEVSAQ